MDEVRLSEQNTGSQKTDDPPKDRGYPVISDDSGSGDAQRIDDPPKDRGYPVRSS